MNFLKLFLVFIITSCQLNQRHDDLATIDFDKGKLNRVTINKKHLSSYGPNPLEEMSLSTDIADKVNAFIFYPSLYNSFSYISLLQELDFKDRELSIIASYGMSAIVAGIYARDGNSSRLDWIIFRLIKNLKKEEPFSKSWKNTIEDFLVKEFGSKTNTQLKKLLLVPRIVNRKLSYPLGVPVKDLILDSFYSKSGVSIFLKPVLLNQSIKKEFKPDHIFSISSHQYRLKIKKLSSDRLGHYAKLSGFIYSQLQLFFNINIEEPIDKLQDLDTIKRKYSRQIESLAKEIKYRLNSIKEDRN